MTDSSMFSSLRTCRHGHQGCDQLIHPDRFAHVIVHARSQAQFAVALHGVGCHRYDARALARGPPRGDLARGLKAIHLRHLHVHQHHIVGLASDALYGLDAVAGEVGAVALALRTWICNPIARAAASTSLNVASVPGALVGSTSTAIRMAPGTSSRRSSNRFDA